MNSIKPTFAYRASGSCSQSGSYTSRTVPNPAPPGAPSPGAGFKPLHMGGMSGRTSSSDLVGGRRNAKLRITMMPLCWHWFKTFNRLIHEIHEIKCQRIKMISQYYILRQEIFHSDITLLSSPIINYICTKTVSHKIIILPCTRAVPKSMSPRCAPCTVQDTSPAAQWATMCPSTWLWFMDIK